MPTKATKKTRKPPSLVKLTDVARECGMSITAFADRFERLFHVTRPSSKKGSHRLVPYKEAEIFLEEIRAARGFERAVIALQTYQSETAENN